MKLPLAFYGDDVLRKKAIPVLKIDASIKKLVSDMAETMEANNGCGLAANQVHQPIALFITRIPKESDDESSSPGDLRVFINPKILSYSDEMWPYEEACLSIPGVREVVERPSKVTFQAMDLNGKIFIEEFTKFDAHVMMHENDHINGVLYIDRIPIKQKKKIENRLREIKKRYMSKKK